VRRASTERIRTTPSPGTAWLSRLRSAIGAPLGSASAALRGVLDGADGPLTSEQRNRLHDAERRVAEAQQLVCDLLDLAQLEGGDLPLTLSSFVLEDLVREVMAPREQAARSRGLTVAFVIPPRPLPMVNADRARVGQVLGHLLDAAVRAGGSGQVTISTELYNRSVALHVSDRGPGLAPGVLNALLRDPEIGDADSERLSFTLSRRLVSRMGGDLWGTSTPGEGSRFSFTVPRAADDTSGGAPPSA
jgi:two-component system, sensor histidine kinase ChiS